MGKRIYDSKRQVCATCEYWCGNRTPTDKSCRRLVVEDTQKSTCIVRRGYVAGATYLKCAKYKKVGWLI